MRRLLTWAVVLLLVATGVATAQENTTGSISGTITDDTGAVLPGATISVISDRGTQTYVSGANGKFLAPFLIPGTYVVRVELQGYRPVERDGVGVPLARRVELPFMMSISRKRVTNKRICIKSIDALEQTNHPAWSCHTEPLSSQLTLWSIEVSVR